MRTSEEMFEEGNENSLQEFLIGVGLTKKEIEMLKKEANSSASKLYANYSNYKYSDEENLKLVPVERIIGIGSARGTIGVSWFENLLNYHEHNFRETTIHEFLHKMNGSLNSFKDSFELEEYSGDNLRFAHFKDENLYVSGSGGSHRTLFAKISGAKYILAKVSQY